MSISTTELTISDPVTEATVSDETIRGMYEQYRETTPLKPVDYEIYERFARFVLLPLNTSLEQWKQSRPEFTTSDLRDAFEYVLVELIAMSADAQMDTPETLMQIMRCLSPLTADIYPDSYFQEMYHMYKYIISILVFSTNELTLKEFSNLRRTTSRIAILYGSVISLVWVDIDVTIINDFVHIFQSAMFEEAEDRALVPRREIYSN